MMPRGSSGRVYTRLIADRDEKHEQTNAQHAVVWVVEQQQPPSALRVAELVAVG